MRLEVNQPYPDYTIPVGSLLRDDATGESFRLLRREHCGGQVQVWWVEKK